MKQDNIRQNLERIRGKIQKGQFGPGNIDMVYWHHIFCRKYGWIRPEDFANMPAVTFMNLAGQIITETEEERKAYEKARKRKH